jgi:hypothetical protein
VGRELAPSSSVRRPRWFEQTLKDAQEHVEAPKSTFKESRPPRKFPNYMALMSSIIDVEPSSFSGSRKIKGLAGYHDGGVHLHHEE